MKRTIYFVGLLLLLFLGLTTHGWGQTCPGGLTATNNWCGSYTTYDANCRSGFSGGSCGVHYNVGFFAKTGALSGNPSISAPELNSDWGSQVARPDVAPNASVGLSQYAEFANKYVQAYDKSTGLPIFVDSATNTTFRPQPANGPWSSNQSCGVENNDFTMSYDHVNSVWVLVGMAKVVGGSGNITKGVLCITVSTTDNLIQSDTHCDTHSVPCSFWNTYGFDITSLLPSVTVSGTVYYDLPDYAKFGTWVKDDNYYVTFDLLDYEPNSNAGIIHGFAACQISGSTLRAGNEYNGGTTKPVTCYDRLNANWDSGGFAQIHTLVPADSQNSAAPTSTNGEYFLATVNPFVSGSPCVPSSTQPCTSDRLAFWTWSNIQSKGTPNYITTNSSFIPGCYYTGAGGRPYGDTACVPQPGTTNPVDSVGDRLMSPLAYRYVTGCDEHGVFASSCEYLAVTQTIQEDQAWNSTSNFYADRATGIRYYTLVAPSGSGTVPTILYEGDFYDTNGALFYWMSSNAIDSNQVVGYAFNIGDGTSPNYARVYADTLDAGGNPGTLTSVQTGTASITDTNTQSWGEVASMSMDPSDDLTFWGVGEYLTTAEDKCSSTLGFSDCEWLTTVFSCKKGSGVCP